MSEKVKGRSITRKLVQKSKELNKQQQIQLNPNKKLKKNNSVSNYELLDRNSTWVFAKLGILQSKLKLKFI